MSTAVGAVLWFAADLVADLHLVERLLLLAALVVAPQALRLLAGRPPAAAWPGGVGPDAAEPSDDGLWRACQLGQLPAATLLIVAVALPDGGAAAALTVPWLVFGVALALRAARRLLRRGVRPVAALAVDAAAVHLAAGAGWWTLAAAGARPGDLDALTVWLTAVHLHGGLALAVVAGIVSARRPGVLTTAGGLGVVAGIPLGAVGVLVGPPWQWSAALLLAAAVTVVAGSVAAEARAAAGQRALWRAAQGVSAAALGVAAVAAAVHAGSRLLGSPLLDAATVAVGSAGVTAVGVGVVGLLAWNDTRPAR